MKPLVALAPLAVLLPMALEGCSCAGIQPPCAYVAHTDQIFIGKVVEMSSPPRQFRRVRMEVERVFKGTAAGTVDLFDDGMCDGPRVQIGARYLMYTMGNPMEPMPLRGCTRSRAIEQAAEDLKFLSRYAAGKAESSILVEAYFPRGEDGDDGKVREEDPANPARNVRVTISGAGSKFTAMTNRKGLAVFGGLRPGTYRVEGLRPDYVVRGQPEPVDVVRGGCAIVSLPIVPDFRIEGVVADPSGHPVSRVRIDLEPEEQDSLSNWGIDLGTETDEDGRFGFRGLAAGRYRLAARLTCSPPIGSPFSVTYYPDLSAGHRRSTTTVRAATPRHDLRLELPERLRSLAVIVEVRLPDGSRPPLAAGTEVYLLDPRRPWSALAPGYPVGADGEIRLELCERIEYLLVARARVAGRLIYSTSHKVIPEMTGRPVGLVLDQSGESHLDWLEEQQRSRTP